MAHTCPTGPSQRECPYLRHDFPKRKAKLIEYSKLKQDLVTRLSDLYQKKALTVEDHDYAKVLEVEIDRAGQNLTDIALGYDELMIHKAVMAPILRKHVQQMELRMQEAKDVLKWMEDMDVSSYRQGLVRSDVETRSSLLSAVSQFDQRVKKESEHLLESFLMGHEDEQCNGDDIFEANVKSESSEQSPEHDKEV